MHILRFHVINQKSAVRIGRSEIDAVLLKQIGHNALADPAKVAGDDHIIILRCAPGVRKVRLQRLIGGRRHRRAHVVEILDAGVRDLPSRNRSHLGAGAARAENQRACSRDRPLRRRRAHAAIFQRKAKLALCGTEVRAGQRRTGVCIAAINGHSSKTQRLSHRGTGAVEAKVRCAAVAHCIGRSGALVEQVAGEDIVQRSGGNLRLLARQIKALLEHGALGFLPTGRSKIRIAADDVKPLPQRAFALFFADDACSRKNDRRRSKHDRLFSNPFVFHAITFDASVSGVLCCYT